MTLVPYILAGVIIANFMLSIMILSRGMRDRINEIFGLLSFSVVLWSVGILGFYFIELPDFLFPFSTPPLLRFSYKIKVF